MHRMKKNPQSPLHVVWFKRDLRVVDHAALVAAAHAGAGKVLPLFIAEPGLYHQSDASARQWEFATESLIELREALAKLGQPLVIRTGDAVEILERVRRKFGIGALWSHQETGNGWSYDRDERVRAWCREHAIAWHEPRQHGIIRRLKNRNGWASRWEQLMAEPLLSAPTALQPLAGIDPGGIPTARDLDIAPDMCPTRQVGGRKHAMATLTSFLEKRGQHYRFEMSSPGTAFKSCSRLSPHLAWGTLSMREAASATYARLAELKREPGRDARSFQSSMVSFTGRLHWHCHFMQKLESEPRLEFECLHRAYETLRPSEPDSVRLAAWAAGQTGFPFIDACMRALDATGWLNFRMRAMLMSFASYQLWLPWQSTGAHLARCFTDYEPGIHWPQVQMQSGTTGINTLRIYNPVKQSVDQDPTGSFIRTWVPELAAVPCDFIHEPWKWEQSAAILGHSYPARIVDHLVAAKIARDQLWAVRKSRENRVETTQILDKHGSRKNGTPRAAKNKRLKSKTLAVDQLDLDL
jgi:deoxyribodipyrimidine photo-lyase